ncbi:MAG TPA: hypothetical protein VEP49_20675 [Acidimicrobiia bacterium]|nr:hypothetical protein [Acidimicrobiia bacterium]
MDDSTWERWAPVGGIAFAVLVAVSAAITGSPPKLTDSTAKIVKYIADHQGELRWSAYIAGIGTIGAFWWAGGVWRTLRRAEGGSPMLAVTAVLGLVFGATLAALSGILLATVAIPGVGTAMGAGGVRFFYTLGNTLIGGTGIGILVFTGAFSAVILRTGMLPRLVGWFGVLVAIVWIPGAALMSTSRDAVFYLAFVGFVLFLLWVLAVSITMLRTRASAVASTA